MLDSFICLIISSCNLVVTMLLVLSMLNFILVFSSLSYAPCTRRVVCSVLYNSSSSSNAPSSFQIFHVTPSIHGTMRYPAIKTSMQTPCLKTKSPHPPARFMSLVRSTAAAEQSLLKAHRSGPNLHLHAHHPLVTSMTIHMSTTRHTHSLTLQLLSLPSHTICLCDSWLSGRGSTS